MLSRQWIKRTWAIYWDLTIRLLALASSFISIMSVPLALSPPQGPLSTSAYVAIAFSLFMLAVFVVLEVAHFKRRKVFCRSDSTGIRKYMHNWIQHGGVVAIWTRDLSWADTPDTHQLLMEKARRKELILCLPAHTELSQALLDHGAEVCAYGVGNLERPESRFTIAYYGRDGSSVAVGRADGETHVIEEFSTADHPAYSLAEDLVSIARSLSGNT